jgi:hypothetical protein
MNAINRTRQYVPVTVTPPNTGCNKMFLSSIPFCTALVASNGTTAMKSALASNSSGYRAVLGSQSGPDLDQLFAGQWDECVERPDGKVRCFWVV